MWLARRSDGRYEGQAAIKLLNLASLGRNGAERLRHEANALAKLSHPNITHLIDAGVAAGQPYLVLEYVEGEPIDRWCDARGLRVDARVRLFLQVLGAVSHAHGRLILHRDLKPSNILVTKDGSVKLLDFGIAKLLEGDGQDDGAERADPPRRAGDDAGVRRARAVATWGRHDGNRRLRTRRTAVCPAGRQASDGELRRSTPIEQMQALVDAEPVRLSDAALEVDARLPQMRGMSPLQLARCSAWRSRQHRRQGAEESARRALRDGRCVRERSAALPQS